MTISRSNHRDDSMNRHVPTWQKTITMLLVALSIGSAIFFANNYKRLNASIQKERVTSITQLGTLISDKVLLLQEQYSRVTEQMALTLMYSGADTLESAGDILVDEEGVVLVTADGRYQALDGSNLVISNDQLSQNLVSGTGVNSSFDTVYGKGDFWMFSAPVEDVTIDHVPIIGVVKMVAASQYADVAAVTLFDEMGASFVVGADGAILMRPSQMKTKTTEVFSGYNLLNTLQQEQAPEDIYTGLKSALEQNQPQQFSVSLRGVLWLIQSVPMEAGRSIVIAVPISVTAEDTFKGMNNAIFSAALLILFMSVLLLLWLIFYYRKNQVSELQQVRAKAKNDFLDKMSHDIRTPLNAIVGMHELALRSMDDQEVVHDSLIKAKRSSQYLVSIINDVLDMSRIESGKMSIAADPFSMSELLEHIQQMETGPAREKGITFSIKMENEIHTDFLGDPVRIRQCLVNFISNAIKFTPRGGRVVLTYSAHILDKDHQLVTFNVADNGIGMSEEFLKRIFNPFEQEQSSFTSINVGSGLGLSIVHHLVELMGGEVKVDSHQGQGSTFIMSIPFATTASREKVEEGISDEDLAVLVRGRRVMVVEDNELNREIMCELLKMLELEVVQAENGEEAYRLFSASAPGEYALILMDIKMPVMDGLEATQAIRALKRSDSGTVPIIALSANAYEEDKEKSLQVGMQAHMAKPIELEKLKTVLKEYIG